MTTSPTDRLLSQLNQTQLAQKDNPVYQVIKQLIQRIKDLESLLGGSGATTNITNLTEITQFITSGGGEDGQDGMSIPGTKGDKGETGGGGAAGPITIGPMGLDGADGEDGMPIPGNQGIQGIQGIQGPQGPITLGPMGLDGDDGADGLILGSMSGAGDSPWSLLYTQVAAGANLYDFIGLAAYGQICVICVAIAKTTTGILLLRVSTDNGATFLAASGDYIIINASGAPTNDTDIDVHSTNATIARYGFNILTGFNGAGSKSSIGCAINANYIIPTTTPLNAIRIMHSNGAGTLDSGTIYVYGKK